MKYSTSVRKVRLLNFRNWKRSWKRNFFNALEHCLLTYTTARIKFLYCNFRFSFVFSRDFYAGFGQMSNFVRDELN